jgi:hypothetical protein
MKIYLITDSRGNALGTVQGIPGFDIRIIPLPGQKVLELDVSRDLKQCRVLTEWPDTSANCSMLRQVNSERKAVRLCSEAERSCKKVVCAWCGRRSKFAPREPSLDPATISHGICLECEQALLESLLPPARPGVPSKSHRNDATVAAIGPVLLYNPKNFPSSYSSNCAKLPLRTRLGPEESKTTGGNPQWHESR